MKIKLYICSVRVQSEVWQLFHFSLMLEEILQLEMRNLKITRYITKKQCLSNKMEIRIIFQPCVKKMLKIEKYSLDIAITRTKQSAYYICNVKN